MQERDVKTLQKMKKQILEGSIKFVMNPCHENKMNQQELVSNLEK